jgi:hypothetical protein
MADATETYEETVEDFWAAQDDPTLSNQEDTTVASNASCTDSCPEQAAVTVIEDNSQVIMNTGAVKITTVDLDDYTATSTIQIIDSDLADIAKQFDIDLRFVDNHLSPATATASPPDTLPSWGASTTITTDTDGEYIVNIENVGPQKTWYLVAVIGGAVTASTDAITIGA